MYGLYIKAIRIKHSRFNLYKKFSSLKKAKSFKKIIN